MVPERISLKGRFFNRIHHITKVILATFRKGDKTVLEGYVVLMFLNDKM